MFFRRRGDYAGHGQHVSRVSRAQLHIVDKVLEACGIKNAVRVDKEDEKIVILAEIILVHLVDELEGVLLAIAFAPVGEAGDGDSGRLIGHINTFGI